MNGSESRHHTQQKFDASSRGRRKAHEEELTTRLSKEARLGAFGAPLPRFNDIILIATRKAYHDHLVAKTPQAAYLAVLIGQSGYNSFFATDLTAAIDAGSLLDDPLILDDLRRPSQNGDCSADGCHITAKHVK